MAEVARTVPPRRFGTDLSKLTTAKNRFQEKKGGSKRDATPPPPKVL